MLNPNQVYYNGFNSGLMPDPDLTVWQWSDTYRMLPRKGASEPGRWKTNRTPYLREILECLSPSSPNERIVFMKGAQVGGTECGINWIGYIIHQAPGPALVVQPTGDTARNWSKQRLGSMIEASPALHGLIRDSRERDSGNTTLSKEYPGGILIIASAKSTARLRSMPIRYLFMDEVDEYAADVGGQGDAVSLAEKRTSTFSMRKIYLVSTPTFKNISRIEREYEASDKRRYYVPCPHCEWMQPLKWSGIMWDKDGEKHLPETVHYVCERCGERIEEYHKTSMLEAGEWRSETPGMSKIAGFHLSSLYSPLGWKSWEEIVREFLEARRLQKQGDITSMQVFSNQVLGETWELVTEQADYEGILQRVESYGPEIPLGAAVLTAGCDVQKDRLELEVVAWGKGEESWSIEYKVLIGDPSKPEVWTELEGYLQKTWPHASGRTLRIMSACIDSGYATKAVYDFIRDRQVRGIYAIKGSNQTAAPIISDRPPKKHKTSKVHLFLIGTDTAKAAIFGRLNLVEPGPGFMHYPDHYPPEYFEQLTSERLVLRKGKRVWERKPGKRGEALDARVYALAGLEILKTFSNFNLNQLVDSFSKVKEKQPAQQQNMKQRRATQPGWVNSWKYK
ncbi:MAG: phage terminase large subunit family protein [Nitrospirae bacterium]|nr:phage terminase large subunit family protein [Nitrospirota bacterium]